MTVDLVGGGRFVPLEHEINLVPGAFLRADQQLILAATTPSFSIGVVECEAVAAEGSVVTELRWEAQVTGKGTITIGWTYRSFKADGTTLADVIVPDVSRSSPGPLGGGFTPASDITTIHCRARIEFLSDETDPQDIGISDFFIRAR